MSRKFYEAPKLNAFHGRHEMAVYSEARVVSMLAEKAITPRWSVQVSSSSVLPTKGHISVVDTVGGIFAHLASGSRDSHVCARASVFPSAS